MAQREQLSWEENLVASIAGLGILLLMIAGMLIGFTDSNQDTAELLAIAGAILVVVGAAVWLLLLQPWNNFDDLKTPHYTGHHHDDDHAHDEDDHHELAAVETTTVVADVVALNTPDVTDIQVIEESSVEEPEVIAITDESVDDNVMVEVVDEPAVPEAEAVEISTEPVSDDVVEEIEAPNVSEDIDSFEDVQANLEPDDLRLLEGIGAKVESALNAEGITTFAQLASMSPQEVEEIVKVKQKSTYCR